MKYFATISLLVLLLLACGGCADTEQFRVNGTIEGKPTLNLRIAYYADGAYRTAVTAAREGEFEFYGSAKSPAMVEILDYDYRPLARLYAVNGETYEIKMDRTDHYAVEIRGNRTNEDWSRFLRENAKTLREGGRKANEAVAQHIAANPGSVTSTLLLLTAYDSSADPMEADSLLSLIDLQARPSALTDGYMESLQRLVAVAADTEVMPIPYFFRRGEFPVMKPSDKPYTLLSFTTRNTRGTAHVNTLRSLSKRTPKDRLRVMDLSLDNDTIEWRSTTRPDSATWTQGWVAGNISAIGVDRLAIPSLPFYVICDSTGHQIYRGADTGRVTAVADSLLKL
ncbi:MAG: DUF4369 domain-containing protein [Bacteroidales bacterium]|nr:DUF4369 domain-containing protein [Bacteroidales bacterium]